MCSVWRGYWTFVENYQWYRTYSIIQRKQLHSIRLQQTILPQQHTIKPIAITCHSACSFMKSCDYNLKQWQEGEIQLLKDTAVDRYFLWQPLYCEGPQKSVVGVSMSCFIHSLKILKSQLSFSSEVSENSGFRVCITFPADWVTKCNYQDYK